MPSRPALRVAALSALGLAALAGAALRPPVPFLVWNASASAPLGLYRVEHTGALSRGDLVLAWPPESARRFAAERGYLPETVPLIKRVAAVAGDRVCASRRLILINGDVVATLLAADRQGRPLPGWTGCRDLAADEVFVLMGEVPQSFDGRYFGPIQTSAILGRLVPLWTR
ncbi:MAG: conjugative transfer signal peptidase TraF [Rhodospirillales bacterium]|nr:conjugative transfer signal peptidase TraF [Rhodospirillales bacterium]